MQYIAYHRLGLCCMAAKKGLRWRVIADQRGGYVEGLRCFPSAFI
jgi:hypothetical protein